MKIENTVISIDYGDLTEAKYVFVGCSNSVRPVYSGGFTGSRSNVIEYIIIATTGNGKDFGNLDNSFNDNAGLASSERGIQAGGYSGSKRNVIRYVTIASTRNATDIADLTTAKYFLSTGATATRG